MKTLLLNILNSIIEYSRISCDAVRVRQKAIIQEVVVSVLVSVMLPLSEVGNV